MSSRARRVGVAEAKARFADIVREAPTRRTIIQRRGRDVAVVISVEELDRVERAANGETGGARLLARLERWRRRHGGVEDFDPTPAVIHVENPFGRKAGRRS